MNHVKETSLQKNNIMYEPNERFDIYKLMHKYIRSELNYVTEQCASIDLMDAEQKATFQIKFDQLFELLSSHAENEDIYIGPLLAEISSQQTVNLNADHKKMEDMLLSIKYDLKKLMNENVLREKDWNNFYLKFIDFQSLYFCHLNFEEQNITPVLHDHFNDVQLRQANAEMLKNMPPHRFTEVTIGILKKINHQERVAIYSEMKKTMPENMFAQMYALAKVALSDNAFQKLTSELNLEVKAEVSTS